MTDNFRFFGNNFVGVLFIDHKDPVVTGFKFHVLGFFLSCDTITRNFALKHKITIGALGIFFSIIVEHPWLKKIESN